MCELLTLPTEHPSSAGTSNTHCSNHIPVTTHSFSFLHLTHSSLLPHSLTLSPPFFISPTHPFISANHPFSLTVPLTPSLSMYITLALPHSPSLYPSLSRSLSLTLIHKALPPSFSLSLALTYSPSLTLSHYPPLTCSPLFSFCLILSHSPLPHLTPLTFSYTLPHNASLSPLFLPPSFFLHQLCRNSDPLIPKPLSLTPTHTLMSKCNEVNFGRSVSNHVIKYVTRSQL